MAGEVASVRMIGLPMALGGEVHFVVSAFVGLKAGTIKTADGVERPVTQVLTTSPAQILLPGAISDVGPWLMEQLNAPPPPTIYLP